MAVLQDMRSVQTSAVDSASGSVTGLFLMTVAKQNLKALFQAMENMERYWAGVTQVLNFLEKRWCL
jgi:hypothetical protein